MTKKRADTEDMADMAFANMDGVKKLELFSAEYTIERVREILWPGGDKNHEWGSDTLADIATTLINTGFGPVKSETVTPPTDGLRALVSAPRIADALDGINEKMERFVAHLDKSSRDNDKWLEGRVTIDARTHMVLLEAVQRLSGQFDKWFELQTKPRVMVQAPMEEYELVPLYWSIEDGWVDLSMATLFSDKGRNERVLPIGGEWQKNGSEGGWVIAQVDHEAAAAGEQQSLDGPDSTYLRELAEKVMNIPIMHGVDQSDAEHLYRIAKRLEKK